MKKNIENKVVIITGASSGLGETAALHLAKYGASIIAAARRKDRLDTLVDRITREGGRALAVECDVTKREDLERLAQETLKAYGRIDVLVNNAGLMAQAPLERLKVEEWDRMIDINIKGVLYGIASVLPVMKEQGGGHIINLSSVAG